MLGAQARAAEYNAARNASARQANREAEEQKLPPQPAPIKLSAYTRNPQVNRNKGTKNWIPLVLEEGDEDEEPQPDEAEELTTSSKEELSSSKPKQETPVGPTSDGANRIRVKLPKVAIPVAPRAMRVQPSPIMPAPHAPAMEAWPVPMSWDDGGIPTTPYAGHPVTQTVEHAGYLSDGTPVGMRRYGGMMVPTDITPTKQEQKLSMMSHAYRNPLVAAPDNAFQVYSEVAVNAPPLHHHYSDLSAMVQNPAGDYSLQPFHPKITGMLRRLEPPHYHSVLTTEPQTAIYNPHPNLVGQISLPELVDGQMTPPRPLNLHLRSMNFHAVADKENEEPYDRTKKMQKFIAAQQAVAKTGKTVLNNPELRKIQDVKSGAAIEVKDLNRTPTKRHEVSISVGELIEESLPRTVPKIPPGLEDVNRRLDFIDGLLEPSNFDHGQALNDMFGVGSDDWLSLKPVTCDDRKQMLDVMQYSSRRREEESVFRSSAKDPDRLQNINEWLHTDSRGLKEARGRIDEIAGEYSARLHGTESDKQHDKVDSRADDIHAGLVRGAGNVMATLAEYIAEREKKSGDKTHDYFNRTKLVPEFAVERSGLGANLTLFEDEKSGFSSRPHRIARDPRYRPQAKEGVKVGSEEDWTARFKMLTGSKW